MKIESIFEVEKRYEAAYGAEAIEWAKRDAAAKLGLKIVESVPYEKDKALSWPEGKPLPEYPHTTDHREVDYYRCQFMLVTKPDWQSIKLAVLDAVYMAAVGGRKPDDAVKEIMRAIEYYCGPQE